MSKEKISYLILFIIITTNTNFFNDIYNVFLRKYDERMIRTYSFCNGISYGYIDKIIKKYPKINSFYLVNNEIEPSSLGLFPNLKNDRANKNNIILLNFSKIDKKFLKKRNINIDEYELVNTEQNCFFYKKK